MDIRPMSAQKARVLNVMVRLADRLGNLMPDQAVVESKTGSEGVCEKYSPDAKRLALP